MNKNDFIKNKIQNYYKNKYKNEILICNYIVKRKEDIIFKIISNLANRANNCLKKNKRALLFQKQTRIIKSFIRNSCL
jgi:hypothetical protein